MLINYCYYYYFLLELQRTHSSRDSLGPHQSSSHILPVSALFTAIWLHLIKWGGENHILPISYEMTCYKYNTWRYWIISPTNGAYERLGCKAAWPRRCSPPGPEWCCQQTGRPTPPAGPAAGTRGQTADGPTGCQTDKTHR